MEDQSSFLNKWDSRFMRLAIEARSWTKGIGAGVDRGVGACVVSPNRHQFSLGYAGFPVGIEDTPERLALQDFRKFHTVHAELNAILNARCSVEGWTIYVTEAPCHDCSNAIIQAGIKRAVTGAPRRDSSWHRSQLEGRESMREAGLIVDTTEVPPIEVETKASPVEVEAKHSSKNCLTAPCPWPLECHSGHYKCRK